MQLLVSSLSYFHCLNFYAHILEASPLIALVGLAVVSSLIKVKTSLLPRANA